RRGSGHRHSPSPRQSGYEGGPAVRRRKGGAMGGSYARCTPYVVAMMVLPLLAAPTSAAQCRGKHWVGVWATSPSDALGGTFVDQSLRLVVTPTLGGQKVRVRFSNRFGSESVTFGAATIGLQAAGASLVPGSRRTLRFGGKRLITIAPGGEV